MSENKLPDTIIELCVQLIYNLLERQFHHLITYLKHLNLRIRKI